MRDYALGRKFKLIVISTNSFSHLLEHEEIESCLRCTRDHLEPEGRFVIDIFTPSARMLARDGTQVNHAIWRYTNRDTQENWEIPFSLRMFYPREIDALLRYNG